MLPYKSKKKSYSYN